MRLCFELPIRLDDRAQEALCRIEGLLGRAVVAVEQLVVLATPPPKPPVTGIDAGFEKTPPSKPE